MSSSHPAARTRDTAHRQRVLRPLSTITFIAAQFVPMALLALAYLQVSDQLEATTLGGVSLDALLLTSAVVAPILSQSATGPVFRSLEGVSARTLAPLAALTLRSLPKALMIAFPVQVAVSLGVAWLIGLDSAGAWALAAVVVLHVVFAGVLVPAFAMRSGIMLFVGWGAYAGVLALAPTLWWAPATAGVLSQLIMLAAASDLQVRGLPTVPASAMLAGMVKGIATAVPLWALPLAIYISGERQFSPLVMFVALIPAMLAYQTYFVTVATPLWIKLDVARRKLDGAPYSLARDHLEDLAFHARIGEARVFGLCAVLLVLLLPGTLGLPIPHAGAVSLLIAASCASVMVIAQATRLSMLRTTAASYLIAAAIATNFVVATALDRGFESLLWNHLAVCAAAFTVLAVANRVAWRTPEYSLFWKGALRQ